MREHLFAAECVSVAKTKEFPNDGECEWGFAMRATLEKAVLQNQRPPHEFWSSPIASSTAMQIKQHARNFRP